MSPSAPLVSVIIPAHNAGRHIAATIESVLDQRYESTEIVVVDDGSTDDTAEALEQFGCRVRHIKQAASGLGSARNSGMRAARGDYFAWLDADDLCHPLRIPVQAAILDTNRSVGLIGTGFSAFDGAGNIFPFFAEQYYSALRPRHALQSLFARQTPFDGSGVPWLATPFEPGYSVFWGDVRDTMVWGNFMHPPTIMMRRSVAERTADLNDEYGIAVDWEYLMRASESASFAYVDAPLLQYRLHSAQMSANAQRLAVDILHVVEAVLRRRPDLAQRFPSQTRRLRARTHLRLAQQFAETDWRLALQSFARSLLLHPADRRLPACLLRILLPGVLLRRVRGRPL